MKKKFIRTERIVSIKDGSKVENCEVDGETL